MGKHPGQRFAKKKVVRRTMGTQITTIQHPMASNSPATGAATAAAEMEAPPLPKEKEAFSTDLPARVRAHPTDIAARAAVPDVPMADVSPPLPRRWRSLGGALRPTPDHELLSPTLSASYLPRGIWLRLRAVPNSELSRESAAARRVMHLMHRMPLAVLDRIREFIGGVQCDMGREHEISAVFEWRREWGDVVPPLEAGQVAWVEVGGLGGGLA
jgi:hypothetical protein